MASSTSLPSVGARTDEVLRMEGRSEDHIIQNPKVLGIWENGSLKVAWYYADCMVVLKHDGKMYRVAEVREVGQIEDVAPGD